MARRVLILLLPVLFFLSLLADARDILLPSGEQENKVVDDPLVLHDAFEQNPLSPPSERKNEMKMDVPFNPSMQPTTGPAWPVGHGIGINPSMEPTTGPREDPPRFRPQFPRPSFPSSGYHGKEAVSSSFNIFPREFIPRAENEESGFQPRERAFEHNFVKPVFPDTEHSHGQWEFLNGEEHKYERHENHHGDERKFGHFPGDGPRRDHIHFRPQFARSSSFSSSGDHGIEAVSSSFKRFPGEFLPRAQNEKSGFQRRERAFEHMGGKPVFPEREHRHVQWEFLNGEEHKHDWRHENRHGDERKFGHFPGDGPRGDHLHFRQFPGGLRPRAENEKSGLQPRERAFGHIFVKPVFPDREHSHGPWKFPNGEEDKHGRHEDPPAPWTDWVRSLFGRH